MFTVISCFKTSFSVVQYNKFKDASNIFDITRRNDQKMAVSVSLYEDGNLLAYASLTSEISIDSKDLIKTP